MKHTGPEPVVNITENHYLQTSGGARALVGEWGVYSYIRVLPD